MTWTALLILALIITPTAVACVTVNAHIAKPVDSSASPVSAEQPVLRDPIDTDGPGATFSGGST